MTLFVFSRRSVSQALQRRQRLLPVSALTAALMLTTTLHATPFAVRSEQQGYPGLHQVQASDAPERDEQDGQERTDVAPPSLEDLTAAIERVRSRVQALRAGDNDNAVNASLAPELAAARERIEELTASLTQERAERQRLEGEMSALRTEQQTVEASLAEMQQEMGNAAQRLGESQAALSEAQERIDAAEQAQAVRARELTNARARIRELTDTLSESESARAVLQTEQGELQAALAEAEEELQNSVNFLEAARAERQATERRANELQTNLTAAEQDRTALAEQLDMLRQEVETFEARAVEQQQALRTRTGERDRARARLSELEQANRSFESRLAEMSGMAEQSITEIGTLGDQLVSALSEIDELRIALSEVRASRDTLRDQAAAAAQTMAPLREENARLQQTVNALNARLRAPQNGGTPSGEGGAALSEAQTEIENLRAELSAARDIQGALQEELAAVREVTAARLEELIESATTTSDDTQNRDDGVLRPRPSPDFLKNGVPGSAAQVSEAEQLEAPATAANEAAGDEAEQPEASTTAANDVADGEAVDVAAAETNQLVEIDPAFAEIGKPSTLEIASLSSQEANNYLTDLRAQQTEEGTLMTVPNGIVFASGSDEIASEARATLAKVAELIEYYDTPEVVIFGHTDSIGAEEINLALSKRRADRVKTFLEEQFAINGSRLRTEGLGETAPVASNATDVGRRANRRVEILLRD